MTERPQKLARPLHVGMHSLTGAEVSALCLFVCVVLSLLPSPTLAQQVPPDTTPKLHQRGEPTNDDVRSPINPQVPSTLPSDASGEYKLGKPGDVIEIILDGNGLTGYISMIAPASSDNAGHDKGAVALTYFFDQTELDAKTLSFTTRPVHGKSYSFAGTIVRGPVPDHGKDGYYLLRGTLTLHNTADRSEQPRHVDLPLARSADNDEKDRD